MVAQPVPRSYPYVFEHESLIESATPCPGCGYKALAVIPVFEREGGTGKELFRIPPGDSLFVLDGNLHVIKPGLVVLTGARSFPSCGGIDLGAGDTISYAHLLRYPAWRLAWAKGQFFCMEVHRANGRDNYESGRVIQEPELEWWVLVRTRNGGSGWARLSGDNVDIDAYIHQR